MLYVSIFVELLRSRPSLAVWLAALAQGLLWLLVPSLFYAGPPGDLPSVLAVGHEFQLGTYLGPPLAFWLAELAYDLAGRSLVGVYLLCTLVPLLLYAYWASIPGNYPGPFEWSMTGFGWRLCFVMPLLRPCCMRARWLRWVCRI